MKMTGSKISNNFFVAIETFVLRRRDLTNLRSSLVKSSWTVKSELYSHLICVDFPDGWAKECMLYVVLLSVVINLSFISIAISGAGKVHPSN